MRRMMKIIRNGSKLAVKNSGFVLAFALALSLSIGAIGAIFKLSSAPFLNNAANTRISINPAGKDFLSGIGRFRVLFR